jgi:hypothetical protein
MTSTSEEEQTQNNNRNEWQVIRRTKRKNIQRTQHPRNKKKLMNLKDYLIKCFNKTARY